jgi:FAD/FMN-containing dehydrogenase
VGLGLRRALGDDRVLLNSASRAAYSTDASPFHVEPAAVVVVATEEDVRKTLSVCRELGISLTPRAGGSSLSGGAIGPGVVLETSGLRRILEFSAAEGWVRVQPGVLLHELNAFLEKKGFFFPPNPGSEDVCRIGGMLGHNASGHRTVKYGQTADYVAGLRVLLADGTEVDAHDVPLDSREWGDLVARAPVFEEIRGDVESHIDLIRHARRGVRKHACGYDVFRIADGIGRGVFPLQTLFVGSEGTLGIVVEAKLRVMPLPGSRRSVLLFLDRFEDLGPLVRDLLPLGPSALESVDGNSMDLVGREAHAVPPAAAAMLIVEFDGDDSDRLAERVAVAIAPRYRLSCAPEMAADLARQSELWKIRRGLLPTISKRPGKRKAWGFVEDAAVPVDRVPEFVAFLRELAERYGTQAGIYGHIGDGNVHFRPFFDPNDPSDLERMKALRSEFDAAVLDRFGGVPSAEHGIGRLRADILPRVWGPEVYAIMVRIKRAMDPSALLNPGVLIADTPWWASWNTVKTPLL